MRFSLVLVHFLISNVLFFVLPGICSTVDGKNVILRNENPNLYEMIKEYLPILIAIEKVRAIVILGWMHFKKKTKWTKKCEIKVIMSETSLTKKMKEKKIEQTIKNAVKALFSII